MKKIRVFAGILAMVCLALCFAGCGKPSQPAFDVTGNWEWSFVSEKDNGLAISTGDEIAGKLEIQDDVNFKYSLFNNTKNQPVSEVSGTYTMDGTELGLKFTETQTIVLKVDAENNKMTAVEDEKMVLSKVQ